MVERGKNHIIYKCLGNGLWGKFLNINWIYSWSENSYGIT
jgi:hypothetical protein